jgi:hypothetical protein
MHLGKGPAITSVLARHNFRVVRSGLQWWTLCRRRPVFSAQQAAGPLMGNMKIAAHRNEEGRQFAYLIIAKQRVSVHERRTVSVGSSKGHRYISGKCEWFEEGVPGTDPFALLPSISLA